MRLVKDTEKSSGKFQSSLKLPTGNISSPPIKGQVIYNTPTNDLYYADGVEWKPVSSGGVTVTRLEYMSSPVNNVTGAAAPTSVISASGIRWDIEGSTPTSIGSLNYSGFIDFTGAPISGSCEWYNKIDPCLIEIATRNFTGITNTTPPLVARLDIFIQTDGTIVMSAFSSPPAGRYYFNITLPINFEILP